MSQIQCKSPITIPPLLAAGVISCYFPNPHSSLRQLLFHQSGKCLSYLFLFLICSIQIFLDSPILQEISLLFLLCVSLECYTHGTFITTEMVLLSCLLQYSISFLRMGCLSGLWFSLPGQYIHSGHLEHIQNRETGVQRMG